VTATLRHGALRTLSLGALGLIAAWALPLLVHSLPPNGPVPLGAQLLPIFYVGVVLVLRGAGLSALLVAIAAPSINAQLTGMPAGPMLPLLTAELLIFTSLLQVAVRLRPHIARFAAPLAYLTAAVLARLLLGGSDPLTTLSRALENGWPGLIILLALGALAGAKRGTPA
jgi:hypothetical protein